MRSRHPSFRPEGSSLPFGKSRRLLRVAAYQSSSLETGWVRLSPWPSTHSSAPVSPFAASLPGSRSNVERCFVGVSHTIDFGLSDGSSHSKAGNDDYYPIVPPQPHPHCSPRFLLWGRLSWLVCSATIPRVLKVSRVCTREITQNVAFGAPPALYQLRGCVSPEFDAFNPKLGYSPLSRI